MAALIEVNNLVFNYTRQSDDGAVTIPAIKNLSMTVEEGSFTAIIGRNGSGKSTLAKCLNGLYLPTDGDVVVNGWNTKDDDHIWDIRQTAGMVFQNPDNQLVAALVEDDVAFGPENLGVESEEIARRVEEVLHAVGMEEYRKKASHQLSGGQKQRIAIAGVIAMNPKCVIFDEPTAMLDPLGRQGVMEVIRTLHKLGKTIILITHFMEEAADADRILIMHDGEMVLEGTPQEIFAHPAEIKQAGLDVPVAVELAERLRKKGYEIPEDVITPEQLVDYVCQFK